MAAVAQACNTHVGRGSGHRPRDNHPAGSRPRGRGCRRARSSPGTVPWGVGVGLPTHVVRDQGQEAPQGELAEVQRPHDGLDAAVLLGHSHQPARRERNGSAADVALLSRAQLPRCGWCSGHGAGRVCKGGVRRRLQETRLLEQGDVWREDKAAPGSSGLLQWSIEDCCTWTHVRSPPKLLYLASGPVLSPTAAEVDATEGEH